MIRTIMVPLILGQLLSCGGIEPQGTNDSRIAPAETSRDSLVASDESAVSTETPEELIELNQYLAQVFARFDSSYTEQLDYESKVELLGTWPNSKVIEHLTRPAYCFRNRPLVLSEPFYTSSAEVNYQNQIISGRGESLAFLFVISKDEDRVKACRGQNPLEDTCSSDRSRVQNLSSDNSIIISPSGTNRDQRPAADQPRSTQDLLDDYAVPVPAFLGIYAYPFETDTSSTDPTIQWTHHTLCCRTNSCVSNDPGWSWQTNICSSPTFTSNIPLPPVPTHSCS